MSEKENKTIIFVETKRRCDEIDQGYQAEAQRRPGFHFRADDSCSPFALWHPLTSCKLLLRLPLKSNAFNEKETIT